jgi:hypothetical protein
LTKKTAVGFFRVPEPEDDRKYLEEYMNKPEMANQLHLARNFKSSFFVKTQSVKYRKTGKGCILRAISNRFFS